MLYYYSTKEGSRGSQAPRNTCSLLTATIKPDAEASFWGVCLVYWAVWCSTPAFAAATIKPDAEASLCVGADGCVEQSGAALLGAACCRHGQ